MLRLLPPSLLHLLGTILLTHPTLANPHPVVSRQAGFSFNDLFARWDCNGQVCGYNSQLCCTAGSTCYTNALTQAVCGAAGATAAVQTVQTVGGYWQYYTTTYITNEAVTVTSVISQYIGGASAPTYAPTLTAAGCYNACGGLCCGQGSYCYSPGTCSPAAYGSSYATYAPTPATATPGAPLHGTSSTTTTVTQTPTAPFMSPVATGANVTLTSSQASGGGGLSGGAIAGIVIGVLVGLALLALLIFYCRGRGGFDGFPALFGAGGRRRRRTTEIEEYERRSHRDSRGGRRVWYGAYRRSSRSRDRGRRRMSTGMELLGIGAGLAALWAVLGLKRRSQSRSRRRNEEKYSDDSFSGNLPTTDSSASSDRTRDTRRSYSRR